MCRGPLVHGNCSHIFTMTAFYTGGILRRKRGQRGSYHSTNKGQRSGGSETLHGQRCPRPKGREMTRGLFPRQLPGPSLGMQGSSMAGAACGFPGASEHLLPSPPQPPGLSRWSQKLQDLLGGFPAGGSCPPRAPGSQAPPALPAPLPWGPKAAPPRFLPQGPSIPPSPVGLLPTPEDRPLQPGVLTLDCAAECPRGHSDPDPQAQPQSLVWRPV